MKRLSRILLTLALSAVLLPAAQAVDGSEPAWLAEGERYVRALSDELILTVQTGSQFNDPKQPGVTPGYGVTDRMGNEVLPCVYQKISDFEGDVARIQQKWTGRWSLLRSDGTVLCPDGFETISPFSEGLAAAEQNGLWGYIDTAGNWVIPPQYGSAGDFSQGLAPVKTSTGTYSEVTPGDYCYINTAGQVVIPGPFAYAYAFQHGVALFSQGDDTNGYQDGLVDTKGNQVASAVYDDIDWQKSWTGGLIPVQQGEYWGVLNADTGALVLPCQYDAVTIFAEEGRIAVCSAESGLWGVCDEQGTLVVPMTYDRVGKEGDALQVWQGDDCGLLDWNGRQILPMAPYDRLAWVGSGLYYADGQLLDQQGESVAPWSYDAPISETFQEGRLLVRQNGRCGYLDESGTLMIPCTYESAGAFSDGLAPVQQNGKWGYIDRTGALVVPCQYDSAETGSRFLYVTSGDRGGLLCHPLLADTVSDWAAREVEQARQSGLLTARTEGYFTYDITRLQFAELAVNLVEQTTGQEIVPAPADRFTDTSDEAARKAAAAGIVNGTGDGSTFSPNALITREELAAMLCRAWAAAGGQVAATADLSGYSDAGAVSDWAVEPVSALVGAGVLQGTGGTILPGDKTTVEQAILLVLRVYQQS